MELAEIRERVKNGKNEKDLAFLEALEKLGHSREEAIEIMAVYL